MTIPCQMGEKAAKKRAIHLARTRNLANEPEQMTGSTDTQSDTRERLIAATQRQWEVHGAAGISARQISVCAEVPVSSIYHHFGSLEHLLALAQTDARLRAEAWCLGQLAQIDELPPSPDAFGGFFAQIVDDWTETRRTLAFTWRECELSIDRSPALHAEARAWQGMWDRFWERACDHFRIDRGRVVVKRLFDAESLLHLIRWRRSVDRAGLAEVGQVLTNWLTGSPPAPTPWRDHARRVALETMPKLPERDDVAGQIVAVASRLLGSVGSTQLTHRLVAQHAGVTLGTVSHKFRTKSDLLEAAFEGVYAAMIERLNAGPAGDPNLDLDTFTKVLLQSVERAGSERARDELFLATARDSSLDRFGRQLRYLRGRTGHGLLQSLLGEDRKISTIEGALFSAFGIGQIRAHALSYGPETPTHLHAEYREFLDLFRTA